MSESVHWLRLGKKIAVIVVVLTTLLLVTWNSTRILSVTKYVRHTGSQLRTAGEPRGPWKVLIVAYYRSGSTLTGSIFNDNNETFYVFEPLFPLFSKALPKGLDLKYFNGSIRPCPKEGSRLQEISAHILRTMFSCRFEELDILTLTRMMCTIRIPSNTKFCDCLKRKSAPMVLAQCVPSYTKLCMDAKYRVIKTIRVDMPEVTSVLASHPDLKVIHLLRDPRGMICSQLFAKRCNVTQDKIQQLCKRVTNAIVERRELEKHHSGQFLPVIYEDLVENSTKIAEDMYRLVDSVLPEYINTILHDKTVSGKTQDGSYGTYRQNSMGTAYKWTSRIPWDTNHYVQEHCAEVLKEGRYPVFKNYFDLQKYGFEESLRRAAARS